MANMTKIHAIIHGAAASAAGVGGGLAQIPGSDAPVIACSGRDDDTLADSAVAYLHLGLMFVAM